MQTLAALAVAHEMGIVHRDLKPENIMVLAGTDDEGRPVDVVKVCDFGIAKITDDRGGRDAERWPRGRSRRAARSIGTPEYMSPEQGRGEAPRRAQRPLLRRRDPLPDADGAGAVHGGQRDRDHPQAHHRRSPAPHVDRRARRSTTRGDLPQGDAQAQGRAVRLRARHEERSARRARPGKGGHPRSRPRRTVEPLPRRRPDDPRSRPAHLVDAQPRGEPRRDRDGARGLGGRSPPTRMGRWDRPRRHPLGRGADLRDREPCSRRSRWRSRRCIVGGAWVVRVERAADRRISRRFSPPAAAPHPSPLGRPRRSPEPRRVRAFPRAAQRSDRTASCSWRRCRYRSPAPSRRCSPRRERRTAAPGAGYAVVRSCPGLCGRRLRDPQQRERGCRARGRERRRAHDLLPQRAPRARSARVRERDVEPLDRRQRQGLRSHLDRRGLAPGDDPVCAGQHDGDAASPGRRRNKGAEPPRSWLSFRAP